MIGPYRIRNLKVGVLGKWTYNCLPIVAINFFPSSDCFHGGAVEQRIAQQSPLYARARRPHPIPYVRGGQTFFGYDLLKIYFTFEDRLSWKFFYINRNKR
jgi:hypothetical protein